MSQNVIKCPKCHQISDKQKKRYLPLLALFHWWPFYTLPDWLTKAIIESATAGAVKVVAVSALPDWLKKQTKSKIQFILN